MRLEIVMREIPESLLVSGGRLAIDYARVRVGRGGFLSPQSVDSTFTFDGLEGRNQTSFSGCREYGAESAISFGELPANEDSASGKSSPPAPVSIPAGVIIYSKLETELDPARLATGDPFEATVTKAARQKTVVLAPKGARIHGHVSGVIASEKPDACLAVMLHPDWIEFEGREGAFDAEQVSEVQPVNGPRSNLRRCPWQPESGSAMVLIETGRFASSNGYIVWRTLRPPEEK